MQTSETKSKIALITGASGFIGSEVARNLTARGVKLRVLLRKSSSQENLKGLNYEIAWGDLNDFEALKNAVKGVDYVFHLAGVIAARTKEEYFHFNSEGTGLLAKAVAEENNTIKKFIYVSSLAASGPAKTSSPKSESDEDEPVSAYGESKLRGEKELYKWGKDKFPITVIRPPAVYGPRDKAILEFVKIVNKGVRPQFPTTTGASEKLISLIFVEDLVQGIVEAGLSTAPESLGTFYLTGNEVPKWSEIMNGISTALNKKTMKVYFPSFALFAVAGVSTALGAITKKQFPLTLDKLNELKPDFWICSNVKAKKAFGFTPKMTLNEGLKKTVDWYRSAGWL